LHVEQEGEMSLNKKRVKFIVEKKRFYEKKYELKKMRE